MGSTADKSNTDDYKITRLDKVRLADLSRLHKTVYGVTPAKDHFQRKYNTGHTGIENVGFLAYDAGEPIAFYGVIPCYIQCGAQIVLAAQSADTMTHADHRKKGLFIKLARLTFDLCKQLGIKVIFGFPNQNSHRGLLKLGWITTEVMERFGMALKALPLETVSRNFKWTRSVYNSYATSVLRKYFYSKQGLANSLITGDSGGVHRDDKYLQYKTYSSSQVMQLGPCKIWYKIQNGFVIGDMEGVTPQDFETIIKQLKKICGRLGVREISFQVSPGTALSNLFRKTVPALASFPVMFLDLASDLDLTKLKFTLADLDIF
jgi:GNAT acetyltransferase-like protein